MQRDGKGKVNRTSCWYHRVHTADTGEAELGMKNNLSGQSHGDRRNQEDREWKELSPEPQGTLIVKGLLQDQRQNRPQKDWGRSSRGANFKKGKLVNRV